MLGASGPAAWPPQAEVEDMIWEVDEDCDQALTWPEFQGHVPAVPQRPDRRAARRACALRARGACRRSAQALLGGAAAARGRPLGRPRASGAAARVLMRAAGGWERHVCACAVHAIAGPVAYTAQAFAMLSKLDVKAGTPAPARWVGWRPAGRPRRLRAAAPVQRGAVCDERAGRAADGDAGGRDAYHVPALRAPAAGLAGARGAPAAHGRPQVQTSTALARLPSIMWPNPLARERVRRGRVTCLCQRTVGALPCASRQPALKQASTERRRPRRHRAAGLISGRGRAAGGGVWHRGPERGQDADAVRVPGLPAREPGAAAQQPRHRQDVQGAAARARQAPGRLGARMPFFVLWGQLYTLIPHVAGQGPV